MAQHEAHLRALVAHCGCGCSGESLRVVVGCGRCAVLGYDERTVLLLKPVVEAYEGVISRFEFHVCLLAS